MAPFVSMIGVLWRGLALDFVATEENIGRNSVGHKRLTNMFARQFLTVKNLRVRAFNKEENFLIATQGFKRPPPSKPPGVRWFFDSPSSYSYSIASFFFLL